MATWLSRPATLIVLLLAALTLRFAIAWPARSASLLRDPDGYRQLAEFTRAFRIYSRPFRPEGGIVYESAYRPPLYPLVLMLLISNGVVNTSAVAVLHVLAGVATVALTFRVARL
ncbi:MAG TPA: hypothetical protein PLV92_08215, partial [Pirellulaceae bacterium]|nr:hypothetical protein [Pirellulaceae bacterium]